MRSLAVKLLVQLPSMILRRVPFLEWTWNPAEELPLQAEHRLRSRPIHIEILYDISGE